MKAHTCYHCKQWIEEGEAHDCWTTTEEALTRDLPEDLREAWDRLRESLGDFGEQRIYASHNSIMFSRTACYAFVRPRPKRLEVYFFLGRTERSPLVQKSGASSTVKIAHRVHVTHRDQVEAPLTDWLREAYDVSESLSHRRTSAPAAKPASRAKAKAAAKRKAAAKPQPKARARTTKRAAKERPASPTRRRTKLRAKAR